MTLYLAFGGRGVLVLLWGYYGPQHTFDLFRIELRHNDRVTWSYSKARKYL